MIKSKKLNTNNSKCYNFYYQNVQSIVNKYDEFVENINLSVIKYDVILFTETWCKDKDTSRMFGNIDYNIYRCDRDPNGGKSRGGGVVTLISKECNSEMIYKNNKKYEILITLIKTGVKNLIIINVYLPPLSDLVVTVTLSIKFI